MPRSLALLLTLGFAVVVILADTRLRKTSPALWIPVLWIAITSSRFVSQWLTLGQPVAADAAQDGSTLDAAYFAMLIALGTIVLAGRAAVVLEIVRSNRFLFAFFVYGALSIAWSDFPFISFKRWVKTLGHPVMALVILTDPRPAEAFRAVVVRCAAVVLPLSVLFIKYFPEYGRGFDPWTGFAVNKGVGLTKNDLGYVCMICGLFFLWRLLSPGARERSAAGRYDLAVLIVLLGLALYLLVLSDSATSLVAFTVGAATILVLRFGSLDKSRLGLYVVICAVSLAAIEALFDPYAKMLRLLGRDPDLTDRTEVWADAFNLQPSPLLGAGFEAFWLGERLAVMWDKWWWHPIQAHNGYLETYLNLGSLGFLLLCAALIATFRSITARLQPQFGFDDLRLAYLFAILLFNWTEAGLKGVHLIWTIFMIVALDPPQRSAEARYRRGGPRRRSAGVQAPPTDDPGGSDGTAASAQGRRFPWRSGPHPRRGPRRRGTLSRRT